MSDVTTEARKRQNSYRRRRDFLDHRQSAPPKNSKDTRRGGGLPSAKSNYVLLKIIGSAEEFDTFASNSKKCSTETFVRKVSLRSVGEIFFSRMEEFQIRDRYGGDEL